ncbi:ALDH-like protein [Clavulina sp. PMI_390]|nr:ALDH-like protein [Clavulina sp. PMI_390]KAF8315466.1 ALDH-like protein [Clavulina sp. PMI_390]
MAGLNVMLTVSCLEELAAAASQALAGQVVQCDFPGQTAQLLREPYGVVLGITPWNAPLILAARAAANPIIAGNTVVLKTSELSPVSNSIIAQVFAEAGLPKGVLNVIHASVADTPKVVESIIANPIVRKVNFTGSTRVGSIIGELCGRYIKPSVLELGGAAVVIVLEDADLEGAAKNAVYGSFLHSGQICMSTNNVLVHDAIADEFIKVVQKEMAKVQAGPSENPEDNLLRGVFTTSHASRMGDLVKDAVSKGAKVVVGDAAATSQLPAGSNVVQPVVLDGLTDEMNISSEEIFGPLMGIIRFKTDAEAVQLANKLEYGLSGAVHGRDLLRATKVARQLEINLVHINTFTLHDNAMIPHGGWKKSGYGRFNGFEGIREFTQTKCISFVDQSIAPPIPAL